MGDWDRQRIIGVHGCGVRGKQDNRKHHKGQCFLFHCSSFSRHTAPRSLKSKDRGPVRPNLLDGPEPTVGEGCNSDSERVRENCTQSLLGKDTNHENVLALNLHFDGGLSFFYKSLLSREVI